MKIKLKQKNYAEVKAMDKYVNKQPCRQTAFWRSLLKKLSKKELEECNFSYVSEGMSKLKKNEPCLILMNHSAFTDLEIVATIFSEREYHIVTTLDGFVGKEWLLRHIGCIPARKFISDMPLIKDILYCFKDLKASVVMFPEASYSFDGTATELPESVGKSLKIFNVPVIMVKTSGVYHRDPLYNCLQKRKVDIRARVKYLLSPEDIKRKSVDQLNSILKKEFAFDHWRWQRKHHIKITEGFRADGLERALYKCPLCMDETHMKGEGTKLTCSACGAVWELGEEGDLNLIKARNKEQNATQDKANSQIQSRVTNSKADKIVQDNTPAYPEGDYDFSYVSDWYRWERAMVKQELEDKKYSLDIPIKIVVVKDTRAAYEVGKGRLVHDENGFELKGCEGELSYKQSPGQSYSLYSDYYWYEIGDMISIGTIAEQYYCFPETEGVNVAKVRIATEEMYKMNHGKKRKA